MSSALTDEQLRQRANIFARQQVTALAIAKGADLLDSDLVTVIARAYVIGFACGIEQGAAVARDERVRRRR